MPKLLFTLLLTVVLIGCQPAGDSGPLMENDQATPSMMEKPHQWQSTAQMYQFYCSQCHAAPKAGQYDDHKWPIVIFRMKKHMTQMSKEKPNAEEEAQILAYLRENN